MTRSRFPRKPQMARWHRRVALVVCIWLVFLAVSGILINHAHDWGLDRHAAPAALQRAAYGIEPGETEACESHPSIGPGCAAVFASLALPVGAILLSPDALFLLDADGDLMESVSPGLLGQVAFEAGAVKDGHIYLRSAGTVVRAGPDLLEWEPLGAAAAESLRGLSWQSGTDQPAAITWERVLLDLHAARFLGPVGKAFTDLMAGLILLLAASGLWLWWLKQRGNGNGYGNGNGNGNGPGNGHGNRNGRIKASSERPANRR